MSSFNKIVLVGRLGSDPEIKYTPKGVAVTNFSVATDDRKNVDGKWENVTTWFRVTVWGSVAENVVKYLSKGSLAFFDGKLSTNEWEDSDGNKRVSLEVNCSDVRFLSGAGDNSDGEDQPKRTKAASSTGGSKKQPQSNQDDDDDIPF